MANWKALVPPRLNTTDFPGMCLRFAQSFFGAPARHRSAWHAWLATEFKNPPGTALPNVPVLMWFKHYGAYDDGLGPYNGSPVGSVSNWGHVAVHVPGDAIYTSPLTGASRGSQRYHSIQSMSRMMNLEYVGWTPDINRLLVAEKLPDPLLKPIQGEDEMTKPMIAMKLDGGAMNGLGVLIEPDGSVSGLTPGEWQFWRDTAGCVPVECRNKGHWEYLMGVMDTRRKRNRVIISQLDFDNIARIVRESVTGNPSAGEIASQLQITVKT